MWITFLTTKQLKRKLRYTRLRLYWTKHLCDGCDKVKRRTRSDDGRGIYCHKCRQNPEYKQYLLTEYGIK